MLALIATSRPASAQAVKAPGPAATATATPAEKDKTEEEAHDSPRVSMRRFLDLAEHGRYQEAALYLDFPRGTDKRAAELTAKLHAVLSQRLLILPDQLSPLAQGRPTDGLPANTEELGRIHDGAGHTFVIRIVRHEPRSVDDEPRWVFSQSTVASIDTLYESLPDHWIRKHLPPSLVRQGPMALYYWQWVALPVLAVFCFALGRVLTVFSGVVARRVLGTLSWRELLLRGLKQPTTVGWALATFAGALTFLSLSLRAEDLIQRGLRALAYLTFFWGLLRIVGVIGDELLHGEWARTRPSARSLSSVGVSLGKVIVAAFALMAALSELGYPVTSIIAGLGIGGVALALAAQKTVENLFGSISILADQPFRVGDTVRVDTIEGTVENIGLRSTRIRTVERTLVIFPNGKLADMRIESLGPRDRIRFAAKLQLSRATTTTQLTAIATLVKEKLQAHPSIRKEDVFVRLSAIGEASYDIEVAAPIETVDANEFARVREELLITCIGCVEKLGATLAVPTRQLVGSTSVVPSQGRA
jgi:MscS family membrane protein